MRPFVSSIVAAALLVVLNGARAQDTKPAPQEKKNPWMGTLSEDEFARIHKLKPEEAPPPRGTMVELKDGSKGYLALPEGWKPGGAALVVIHEFWGLNGHIKNWCDRVTATGRAALAVDLYHGVVATDPKDAMAQMRQVDEKKAIETMLAGLDFLHRDSRVSATKIGSIGWCFGGGMSLQLALIAPDLNACVMYYGRMVNDVEQLKKIKCPLLGCFAELDEAFPQEAVEVFDRKLTEAGVKHTLRVFKQARHAFANPSGASYNKTAATDAWNDVQKFLDENLPVKK